MLSISITSNTRSSSLYVGGPSNTWMAPQPEPNQPPKRDTSPMMVPTVGLGNNQVFNFNSYSYY
jgi:hypothetical protein